MTDTIHIRLRPEQIDALNLAAVGESTVTGKPIPAASLAKRWIVEKLEEYTKQKTSKKN